jgi:endoglucanase
MNKESLEFFKKLMSAPSPSGFEGPAAKVFKEYLQPFTEEVKSDVMGNSIGVVNKKAPIRVMLAGHIDQIGLIVNHINDQGFIYFDKIGGINLGTLLSSRVAIHTGGGIILGVIGAKAAHQLEDEERKQIPKQENMFIDCGFKTKEEAVENVSIGDPITFVSEFNLLKNDLAVCAGFDDKMGSFIVAQILKNLAREDIKVSVYGVATVQEELGLRGAKTAAYSINPQVGIAFDVTFASHPGIDKQKWGEIEIGKGPVITRGANINPVIFDLLVKTAKDNNIPYQIDASGGATGTDANLMQVNKEGMATALISVPLRYMHSLNEVLSLKDIENTINLGTLFLQNLSGNEDFIVA